MKSMSTVEKEKEQGKEAKVEVNEQKSPVANLTVIKKKIEQDAEEKCKHLRKHVAGNHDSDEKNFSEGLINIMKEGEKEFVEKTGRCMTYSEMREMYG